MTRAGGDGPPPFRKKSAPGFRRSRFGRGLSAPCPKSSGMGQDGPSARLRTANPFRDWLEDSACRKPRAAHGKADSGRKAGRASARARSFKVLILIKPVSCHSQNSRTARLASLLGRYCVSYSVRIRVPTRVPTRFRIRLPIPSLLGLPLAFLLGFPLGHIRPRIAFVSAAYRRRTMVLRSHSGPPQIDD